MIEISLFENAAALCMLASGPMCQLISDELALKLCRIIILNLI